MERNPPRNGIATRTGAWQRAAAGVATILLFLFYLLALIVDRSAGVLYGLLVLTGVIVLAAGSVSGALSAAHRPAHLLRRYWALSLCMAGPLLAVVANELSRAQMSFRSIDAPLRLALFLPILAAVRMVPYERTRSLHLVFVLAALAAAVKLYILTEGGTVRYGTDFIPIIIFTGLTLLLCMFSALSLCWKRQRNVFAVALTGIALVAGIYTSFLSQSRGPLFLLPLFLLLGLCVAFVRLKLRHVALALTLVLFLAGLASGSKVVRERFVSIPENIVVYQHGYRDTSLGLRFQLWEASVLMLREHPLFGVGMDRYQESLKELAARGAISSTAAALPHSHNEVLFAAARTGILGVVALLCVYFVPVWWFWPYIRHPRRDLRATAGMALSLTFGILILGLTDVVFLWWEIFPFYAIGIALFASTLEQQLGMRGAASNEGQPKPTVPVAEGAGPVPKP